VFCFDGDAAGRKAAWRALENALPIPVDGKNARFAFLPDGEDPDDYVRARGKAAFEALLETATPLSELLLDELAAQHPPTTAEGRASLVTAARPLLAQIAAPVLSALLRRKLAEVAGLPEAELRSLLRLPSPGATASGPARETIADGRGSSRRPMPSSRRAPSLVRELIQGLVLQPMLARTVAVPQPDDGTPEGAALRALVTFCMTANDPLTTPGTLQRFVGTPHEHVLAAALASAHDQGVTPEQAELHLREGVRRYWLQAQRAGQQGSATPDANDAALAAALPAEETERLRQLEMVRRALPVVGVTDTPREGT